MQHVVKVTAKYSINRHLILMTSSPIDNADRTLIDAINLSPTASFRELSKQTGLAERTVARRYQRLHRMGIIRVFGRTLPGFGGTVAWMIRAQLRAEHAQAMGRELASIPRTRWVRITMAHDEVTFGLISSPAGQDSVIQALQKDPRVGTVTVVQLLQTWGAQGQTNPLNLASEVDELDRRILEELAADGRRPHRDVATSLNIDPATVSRRVQRMRDEKILFFEVEMNLEAHSLESSVLVWLTMAPGQIRELATALSSLPEVRFVAATSGPTSLVVSLSAPVMSQVLDFVDITLARFGVSGVEIQAFEPAVKTSR